MHSNNKTQKAANQFYSRLGYRVNYGKAFATSTIVSGRAIKAGRLKLAIDGSHHWIILFLYPLFSHLKMLLIEYSSRAFRFRGTSANKVTCKVIHATRLTHRL